MPAPNPPQTPKTAAPDPAAARIAELEAMLAAERARADAAERAAHPVSHEPAREMEHGKRWIYIQQNEAAAHGIQLRGSGYKVGPLINLVPGWNLVDLALWAEAVRNPGVQRRLRDRIPESHSPEGREERTGERFFVEGPEVEDREQPLRGLSEEAAREIAADLQSPSEIRRLQQVERRGGVLQALAQQLRKIDPDERARTAA